MFEAAGNKNLVFLRELCLSLLNDGIRRAKLVTIVLSQMGDAWARKSCCVRVSRTRPALHPSRLYGPLPGAHTAVPERKVGDQRAGLISRPSASESSISGGLWLFGQPVGGPSQSPFREMICIPVK